MSSILKLILTLVFIPFAILFSLLADVLIRLGELGYWLNNVGFSWGISAELEYWKRKYLKKRGE
ncbi:MAG: hypothetical protein QY317_16245 [Candidatus Jettenia caeni]|nr:MAG: hypothetical protein QY317_16245 [Candidatus Jettenia caeni]